ncbi:hypothetical protein FGO68_gene17813 [Halteria grandinella]|uniref:Uncharacterized protein n=1 Tax=Halteria grandinella TaxID=5974 RepID=A0A8J8SXZ4_HALGN|nr:hypothetical protein FGO68_gene17813 [Halteria grandinella]
MIMDYCNSNSMLPIFQNVPLAHQHNQYNWIRIKQIVLLKIQRLLPQLIQGMMITILLQLRRAIQILCTIQTNLQNYQRKHFWQWDLASQFNNNFLINSKLFIRQCIKSEHSLGIHLCQCHTLRQGQQYSKSSILICLYMQ